MINTRAIDRTYKIIVTGASLVILAAGVLSFTALFDLFVAINLFWWPLAVLFPLLFDLAEVTAAVTVFNAKLQGEDDRFAWWLVLLFTALGITANIAHAAYAYHAGRIDGGQLTLAVGATSLFPLSIALVTHLLKRTIERHLKREAAAVSLAELLQKIQISEATLHNKTLALAEVNAQAEMQKSAIVKELERLSTERDSVIAEIEQVRDSVDSVAEVTPRVREAFYADALIVAAGWTKDATAEYLGIHRNTLNARISLMNGSSLKHREK